MGIGQRRCELIAAEVLQVHTVKKQQIGKFDAIDGAETVELKNTGHGIGVFDLGEPCVRDVIFRIALGFGDLLAKVRNFTRGNTQTEPNILELFARGLRRRGEAMKQSTS